MKQVFFFLITLSVFASCGTQNESAEKKHQYTNQLINESSPYLLQHAHNPVNWHPWNDEALAKAKAENKMLLISVGYAACHWCHVMEHESFEDTTVARIMNENFIPIKVDREERPDVDDIYMTACQMSSNRSCGWPLNAFALPDGRPVFAGTYYPKKEWLDVMQYFINAYKTEPAEMEKYAEQLTQGIQKQDAIVFNDSQKQFSAENLTKINEDFLKTVDFEKGGKKGAPKFPIPANWNFLLRYHHYSDNPQALQAVLMTLDQMVDGGIYDHVGGGFARYSTDDDWLVPHFEKMLYDNGQLVSLYADAYKLTKNEKYKKSIEETLEFIAREMTDPKGGFYSSLDADSEGEEGKFYVWTKSEIDSIVGADSEIFCNYYEIKANGNWEHGKNILHTKNTIAGVATQYDTDERNIIEALERGKKALFEAREKRVRPGLDDKILSSWNALMLKGYADAYAALGNENYKNAAIKNGEFLLKYACKEDGRLTRNFKDGKSVINGFLDDYALTIQAFTSLYQITFDEKWLNKADELAQYALEHFKNKETGMFYYTSDLDSELIARKTDLVDNVIPGSNSSMARALFTLGTYLYKAEYIEMSEQMMHNMQEQILKSGQPNFYSNWCSLYLDLVRRPYEVAIVGADFEAKRKELISQYQPNALYLGGTTEGELELLEGKLQEGMTMIYVCQNKVCKLPVEEAAKALDLMK